jgi:2-polyprenyl-3-methyl-5-hydroxy-6-metoxy-1,4-benzoquinol methylase
MPNCSGKVDADLVWRLVLMACVVCGSVQIETVNIARSLRYRCCRSCSHCLKLPSASDISQDYSNNQEIYYDNPEIDPFAEPQIIKDQKIGDRTRFARPYLQEAKSLLEVGPGEGNFLQWANQSGFACTACEQSSMLSGQLAAQGYQVIQSEFETASIDRQFDAIFSFHIIEHVVEPLDHLKHAYALTVAGGHMIVATPNSGSWQHRLNPRMSVNFDMAHIHVFSKQSLKMLAEQAGWQVVGTATPENVSGWLRFITRQMRQIRKEDASATAGKYASIAKQKEDFKFWLKLFSILSYPIRIIQQITGNGSEIFFALRKA